MGPMFKSGQLVRHPIMLEKQISCSRMMLMIKLGRKKMQVPTRQLLLKPDFFCLRKRERACTHM